MDTQNHHAYIRKSFQLNSSIKRELETQILSQVPGAESVSLGEKIIVRSFDERTGETVFTGEWSTVGNGVTINTGLFTAKAIIKNETAEIAEFEHLWVIDLTFL